jgi:hypothetical protein
MNDNTLLEKAQSGTISRAEIAQVAHALQSNEAGEDRYTLIHILGRSGAVEYESLIVSYLNAETDPMLARIALQVLCSHWNRAGKYRDRVTEFVRGVKWDINEEVRLAAISIAGELLRAVLDTTLLCLLVDICTSAEQAPMSRQAAYCALARAYGKDWHELPPATRSLDLERETDPSVLAWAMEHI